MQLLMLVLLDPLCCLSVLSHESCNASTTNQLVNLRLPRDRVGLARQPFGCRQAVKLQMFALHLAFRPRTCQVGLGTAAKGLATQHLLLMLHWLMLLLLLSLLQANLHLGLDVLWLPAQQSHDRIALS